MQLSIIIPTYNEAEQIGPLIRYLQQCTDSPIYVANSPATTDATAKLAHQAGARVLECPQAGRAQQMNFAAKHCTNSDVLYFVHADTYPPESFYDDIQQALQEGVRLGYFRYRFDSDHLLLRINSYCTRFNGIFAGGGDQTLFIKKSTFEGLDGFRDELKLMEDFDLIARARQARLPLQLIPKEATVSARKYNQNTWLRVNAVNLWVFLLFHMGVPSKRLSAIYRRLLN